VEKCVRHKLSATLPRTYDGPWGGGVGSAHASAPDGALVMLVYAVNPLLCPSKEESHR